LGLRPKNTAGSHEMSKETVRIEMCPHCRGAHAYQLEVERANIIKVLRTHKKGEKPSRVKVSPHFVCPVRNEKYQVSLYLQDTSSDRIRAVSVIGLVEEADSKTLHVASNRVNK
jgi:Zn-finger nucleic acid-binding protein